MMNKKITGQFSLLVIFSLLFSFASAQVKPAPQQLAWHDMEFYLFAHFGPNTFTDLEWGHGDEKEEIFNPTKLDCNQWCRVAKSAGAKGIIITAKHHDGFCLWPSKFSKHTVRESKWKEGKGDVLKELSAACKKYGLKFGVYISPWDRNHPDYGTEKYNDVFVGMMKELFTNYGPIWELWWDGANGEGPNGKKQVYDWKRFKATARKLSPNTVIFSDVGPDIRWVGNENGIAGNTNWNTLNTDGFEPGEKAPATSILNSGEEKGKYYIPAECDVSIRPGWFYHKAEDNKVKTPEQLFQLYLKSVGRGANLLLNVPPDGRGLITEFDSAALMGFMKLREESFKNNVALKAMGYKISNKIRKPITEINDGNTNTVRPILKPSYDYLGIQWKKAQEINCIIIREDLTKGQLCTDPLIIVISENMQGLAVQRGNTIGNKRIYTFPKAKVKDIEFTNTGTKVAAISEIEAYLIPETLIEK